MPFYLFMPIYIYIISFSNLWVCFIGFVWQGILMKTNNNKIVNDEIRLIQIQKLHKQC